MQHWLHTRRTIRFDEQRPYRPQRPPRTPRIRFVVGLCSSAHPPPLFAFGVAPPLDSGRVPPPKAAATTNTMRDPGLRPRLGARRYSPVGWRDAPDPSDRRVLRPFPNAPRPPRDTLRFRLVVATAWRMCGLPEARPGAPGGGSHRPGRDVRTTQGQIGPTAPTTSQCDGRPYVACS